MAIPTPGVKTIVQFIRISCRNFLICCLIVWFILSIFPLDCGLHRVCKSHLICKNFETSQIISTTKWGPLSDEIPSGTQNLGISFNNTITTSLALLVWHGKASGRSEKVSTITNKYLYYSHLYNSENQFASSSQVQSIFLPSLAKKPHIPLMIFNIIMPFAYVLTISTRASAPIWVVQRILFMTSLITWGVTMDCPPGVFHHPSEVLIQYKKSDNTFFFYVFSNLDIKSYFLN